VFPAKRASLPLPGVYGTGLSFADFLTGYADNLTNRENIFFPGRRSIVYCRQQIYRDSYFDDSWRATAGLTVNLGLRYDLQGPWSVAFKRVSYFDPKAK